jgi:hypothetical protein
VVPKLSGAKIIESQNYREPKLSRAKIIGSQSYREPKLSGAKVIVSTKKKPWHCCCHRWQERKKKKQQGVPSSPMTLRRSGVSLDVIGGTGAADLAAPHECSGGIIHPRGDFAHTLDTVVFAVLAYCAFYTPYRIGFDLQPEGFLLVFELAIDCLFIFEIFVQFRKGYPLDDFDEDSRIDMMPRPIAKNYLKGWFWVDLLAAVPTQLIWGAESSASNRLPRLFRLPRMLRMMRLVQLLRFTRLFRRSSAGMISHFLELFGMSSAAGRAARLAAITLVLSHAVSCGWFFCHTIQVRLGPCPGTQCTLGTLDTDKRTAMVVHAPGY